MREAGYGAEVMDWRIYVRIGIFVDLNVHNDYEKFFVSLLVSELSKRGHEISLYVPENMECGFSGAKNTVHLVGKSESSNQAGGLKKIISYVKFGFSRQGWFSQLFLATEKDALDAVIFPFADYRCLRAVQKNNLRDSSVPILFFVHNLAAGSAIKVFREAKKMSGHKNLRIVALTFDGHLFPQRLESLFSTYPPVQEADIGVMDSKILEGINQKALMPEAFALRVEKIINAEYTKNNR